MKANGGQTPNPTPSASASSFDGNKPASSKNLKGTAASNRSGQKALKTKCLKRDNRKCMLSGYYDNKELGELSSGEQDEIGFELITRTECAHIVPYSTGPSVRNGEIERDDVRILSEPINVCA